MLLHVFMLFESNSSTSFPIPVVEGALLNAICPSSSCAHFAKTNSNVLLTFGSSFSIMHVMSDPIRLTLIKSTRHESR